MSSVSVYIMECAGYVKVGLAADPVARLKDINIGAPIKASLYRFRTFDSRLAAHEIESRMHRQFARKRTNGEWFDITPREAWEALKRQRPLRDSRDVPEVGKMQQHKLALPRLPIDIRPPEDISAPWEALAATVVSGDRDAMAVWRRKTQGRMAELRGNIQTEADRIKRAKRRLTELDKVIPWMESKPCRLESATSPAWPNICAATDEDRLEPFGKGEEIAPYLAGDPQIFLVQHDWAAAFGGAGDFDAGPCRLPYDHCVFEFNVEGNRVVVVVRQEGDQQIGVLLIRAGQIWLHGAPGDFAVPPEDRDPTPDDHLQPLNRALHFNIRAICIALDAEVAATDVLRAPSNGRQHFSAASRSGYEYRVVRLAHRSRTAPLPSPGHDGHRKRLHFRRGHWRHYEAHKTWIRWMLVGDPDLGFIDKHYRA